MNSTKIFLIFLLLIEITVIRVLSQVGIPSYIHLCKRNDPNLNQCVINTFNEIRSYMVKGIPELNLPPAEPLTHITAAANTGKGTSVELEIELWNIVLHGLTGAEITHLNLNLDRPSCEITLAFPYLRAEGEYKLKGKMLFLEVDSTGKVNLNVTNPIISADVTGEIVFLLTEKYFKPEAAKIDFQIQDAQVYFYNLVQNDEVLTHTLNQAINENIGSIVDELKPLLSEILEDLIFRYLSAPFREFSINKLFPLD